MMSRITSSGKCSQVTAWPASLAKLSKSRSDPASVDNTSSDSPEGMPRNARFAINKGIGQRSPRASTVSVGVDKAGIGFTGLVRGEPVYRFSIDIAAVRAHFYPIDNPPITAQVS